MRCRKQLPQTAHRQLPPSATYAAAKLAPLPQMISTNHEFLQLLHNPNVKTKPTFDTKYPSSFLTFEVTCILLILATSSTKKKEG